MMRPDTGDYAFYAPKKGTETFGQRGIQSYGNCPITHGEVISKCVDGIYGGNAHIPYFTMDSVFDRCSGYDIAIYRWHKFANHPDCEYYRTYKECVASILRVMAELRLPYDKKAIKTITRNYLLKMFFKSKAKKWHIEHEIFCIESIDIICRAVQVDIFQSIRPQAHLAPVHCANLILRKKLVLVEDCGLHTRVIRGS